MAHAIRPLVLSPEEKTELEQKSANAERSAEKSPVPSTVVDLFTRLRGKLDDANEASAIELDPDLADELERALDEADEDLRQGRHMPRDAIFLRHQPAG